MARDPLEEGKRLLAAGKKWEAKPLLFDAARVATDRAPILEILAANFALVASGAKRLALLSDPASRVEARVAAVRETDDLSDPRFAVPLLALLEACDDNAALDALHRGWKCFGRADLARLEALRDRAQDRTLKSNLGKVITYLLGQSLPPRPPTREELCAALPHIPPAEIAAIDAAAERVMTAFDGCDWNDRATIEELVSDLEHVLREEHGAQLPRDRIVAVFALAHGDLSEAIAGLAQAKEPPERPRKARGPKKKKPE
jgi:hypothetical protein